MAVGLSGGLVAWASVGWSHSAALVGWMGAASTLTVAAAVLVGWAELLAAAITGIVGLVAAATIAHPSPAALAVGLAAYALAELAFDALAAAPVRDSRSLRFLRSRNAEAVGHGWAEYAQRAPFLAAVVTLSVLVGGVALLAAGDLGDDVADATALALEALGLVAVVAVTGLLVVLARRAQRPRPRGVTPRGPGPTG